MRWSSLAYFGVAFLLHGAAAYGTYKIPKPTIKKHTMVAVADKKKKEEKKEDKKPDEPPPPPKPPPPVKKPPPPKAVAQNTPPPPAAAAAPAAAPHPALAALPNLGISLAGGVGGGGIAVPTGPVSDGPAAAAHTEAAQPAAKPREPDCTEAVVKPKLQGAAQQPAYTEAARSAGVEGKVRVEVQVDATGSVTSARVVSGLGYGLDEAALIVARRMKFTAGTRCGKSVAATFMFSYRFALE